MNASIRYDVVSIPTYGLGKWGRYAHAAELRIRKADDPRPLKGRGCHDGLLACYRVDTRYQGPRSYYGKLLREFGITA
jgi:hypothetical protein